MAPTETQLQWGGPPSANRQCTSPSQPPTPGTHLIQVHHPWVAHQADSHAQSPLHASAVAAHQAVSDSRQVEGAQGIIHGTVEGGPLHVLQAPIEEKVLPPSQALPQQVCRGPGARQGLLESFSQPDPARQGRRASDNRSAHRGKKGTSQRQRALEWPHGVTADALGK